MREQYPDGIIRLEVIAGKAERTLDESGFWELIAQLDWTQSEDVDITRPVEALLQARSVADIYTFQDILTRLLYQLDGPAYAVPIRKAETHFSVDHFLYVRAAVVANGEAYYYQVLEDPSAMPTTVSFEPLLYIAGDAYRTKTGGEMVNLPSLSYETYFNRDLRENSSGI